MLRFCPPLFERITHTRIFEATYAGGEANVAVSLTNYGMDAYFVSKLPSNFVGDATMRCHGKAKMSQTGKAENVSSEKH